MKKYNRFGWVLLSSFVLVLVAACDKPGPAETAGKKIDKLYDSATNSISNTTDKASEAIGKQTDTATQFINDSEITARVKSAILKNDEFRFVRLNVVTTNGVVTISGSVSNKKLRSDVINTVESVDGVASVVNKITVNSNM